MSPGKIAAQVGHATLGAYLDAVEIHPAWVSDWLENGAMKVTVKVPDANAMEDLKAKAEAAGVPTHIVADAGHTQIPAGSRTILAIGPAPIAMVDSIARHLPLY